MAQNKNKDKWIEEVLNSADKIRKVEVSPFIYPKILHKLKEGRSSNIIPVRRAVLGFITIILLAVINLLVIFNSVTGKSTEKNSVTKTVSSSQFIPSQYNPYLEILNNN